MKQNSMKIIGIMGGVGTGKSTIATILEQEYSAFVIMADSVGHKAMEPKTDSYTQILELFGTKILNDDNTMNRKKIAEIVFYDASMLEKLNQIVHPFVEQYINAEIKRVAGLKTYSYLFIESAILIETGYQKICDEIWVVQTEESIRRKRLKESRGYSDEKIDKIMGNQMGEKELLSYSDKVIINNGDLAQIRVQLENLLV